MQNKTVSDVYVTTAKSVYGEYAFAVFIRYADGSKGHEVTNRSVRDALICGNGMIHALQAVGVKVAANVVFDPRLER